MATPLALHAEVRSGSWTLIATGEIDLSNVERFAAALSETIGRAGTDVATIDLADVEYLDSSAITALFDRAGDITVRANPILIRGLTVSGLTELVTVVPTGA